MGIVCMTSNLPCRLGAGREIVLGALLSHAWAELQRKCRPRERTMASASHVSARVAALLWVQTARVTLGQGRSGGKGRRAYASATAGSAGLGSRSRVTSPNCLQGLGRGLAQFVEFLCTMAGRGVTEGGRGDGRGL